MHTAADGTRPRLALWDVRDVEGHVRALADATLRDWKAHLDPIRKDDLVAYLMAECWRVSGLDERGDGPRHEYLVRLTIDLAAPRWSTLEGLVETVKVVQGPYTSHAAAHAAGELAAAEHVAPGDTFTRELVPMRPKGCYDPTRGLAFSTFSRRILSMRVVDWYRVTFGDSRYGDHQLPLSLEGLVAAELDRVDRDGFLERSGPGARDDFVDELHPYVYDHELSEEASTRAAVAL